MAEKFTSNGTTSPFCTHQWDLAKLKHLQAKYIWMVFLHFCKLLGKNIYFKTLNVCDFLFLRFFPIFAFRYLLFSRVSVQAFEVGCRFLILRPLIFASQLHLAKFTKIKGSRTLRVLQYCLNQSWHHPYDNMFTRIVYVAEMMNAALGPVKIYLICSGKHPSRSKPIQVLFILTYTKCLRINESL